MQSGNALMRLCICTASSQPSLFVQRIRLEEATKIQRADPICGPTQMTNSDHGVLKSPFFA